MRIIPLKQSSKEWLEWRKTGVTASDISCLFGTNPFKTEWQLWAEKTGRRLEDDPSGNPYVRAGKNYEFILREHISKKMDVGLFPACVEHADLPFIKASLDGIDGARRPWELKILSEGNYDLVVNEGLKSEPVQRYTPQIQAQMLATGAREGFLVFGKIDDTGHQPVVVDDRLFVIAADNRMHAVMKDKVTAFMRRVKDDDPPPKDPDRDLFSPTTPQQAQVWQQAADIVLPLIDRKKALQSELEQLDERIKEEALPALNVLKDNKSGVFAGLRITRVDRTGSVDWKALLKSRGLDADSQSLIGPFQKQHSKSYKYSAI